MIRSEWMSNGASPYSRLKTLSESVNETARIARISLSLTLIAALYLTLTLLSATDENMFRNTIVTLPRLETGISLERSYLYAPMLFLYLHLQTLYLSAVLTRRIRRFEQVLVQVFPYDRQSREECREWLSGVNLVQGMLGSTKLDLVGRSLMWFGIGVVPVLLLFFVDVSFLRYQATVITVIHHVCFFVDLTCSWLFWWYLRGGAAISLWSDRRKVHGSNTHNRRSHRIASVARFLTALMALLCSSGLASVLLLNGWPIKYDELNVEGYGRPTGFNAFDKWLCRSSGWRGFCRTLNLDIQSRREDLCIGDDVLENAAAGRFSRIWRLIRVGPEKAIIQICEFQ